MAVGDIYEVSVDMAVRGENCVNVFRFREAVEATLAVPAEEVAKGFQTAIIADWKALLSNQVKFNCIYARRIRPNPGVAYTVLLTDEGEEVSEAIPTTSALLITWYSALADKRGRGRNYFAGLPETSQAGGALESDVLAAWQAFAATLATQFPAGGGGGGEYALCVYSDADVTGRDVITQVVRTNLGTMRSRRTRPGTS